MNNAEALSSSFQNWEKRNKIERKCLMYSSYKKLLYIAYKIVYWNIDIVEKLFLAIQLNVNE